MPVRALFSSFLLALVLLTGFNAAAASAAPKHPKAKVALKKKKKKSKRTARAANRYAKPAPPAAPVACANTDLVPDAGNLNLIAAALLCLHNQVRAQNGLGALRANGALDTAGIAHSQDMVARSYFDHVTPDGGTFDERIIAAGYAGEYDGWTLGENLAWGTGSLATPAGLMRSWMASAGHRRNILKSGYRELGIGLRTGTPSGAADGITVSAEFGVRML